MQGTLEWCEESYCFCDRPHRKKVSMDISRYITTKLELTPGELTILFNELLAPLGKCVAKLWFDTDEYDYDDDSTVAKLVITLKDRTA